jgi:hypothetical protein
MASGDIPVDGSAVDVTVSGQSFKINATNFAEDGKKFLLIRTNPAKRLHIFVDTDTTNPGSKKLDEDVNSDAWQLTISEL